MNKSFLTVVLTLTCLLGLGISARAQDVDKVVANVPFDFVAGGESLPAGKYSAGRISPETNRTFLISGSNNNSLFLIPMFFDDSPVAVNRVSADHAELGFEHVGDKYFLSKVET